MGKQSVNRIEIFIDKKKQFRFRVVAENGETIAQSEGYVTRESAKSGIRALRQAMKKARTKDMTRETTTHPS